MRKFFLGLLIAVFAQGAAYSQTVYDRDGKAYDLDAMQKEYGWDAKHKKHMAEYYKNYGGTGENAARTLDMNNASAMQEMYAHQENLRGNAMFKDDYLEGKSGVARKNAIEQIDMFGRVYQAKYGFPADKWFVLIGKKAPEQKIAELKAFIENIVNNNYAQIKNVRIQGEDVGFIRENINRINDDFDDKVAGLTPVIETREEVNNGIKHQITTATYTDQNGKRYVREERRYPGGVEPIVKFRETNQPLFDYKYVKEREDGDGFMMYSGNSGVTIGTGIPAGYSVARDRSEFLGDDDKGRLVVVPNDPSMLPSGVSVVDDGRGGKILRAASPDVFKDNGNLKLPPDPTLEKTTTMYYNRSAGVGLGRDNQGDLVKAGKITSQATAFVANTQSGGNYWYGDTDSLFYSYSEVNDRGKANNHTIDRNNQPISYCNGKKWSMEIDERTGWSRIPDWVEKECSGRQ